MILDDFGAFERDKWSAIDTASGLCLAVPLAPAGMAEGDEGDAQYDPYQALGEETEDTGDYAGEEVDFIIDTEGTEATEGNEGKEATEATEGTEGAEGTEGTGVSKQEEHEKSGHVEEEVDWGTEDETDAPETQPEESNEAGNEGEAGDKSGDPEPAQSSADAAEEDDDDDCLIVSVVKAPPPTPKAKGKGKEGKGNKGTKGANKGNKSQWTNKGNKWNKWKTNDPPAKGHSKGKGKGKNWFVAPSGPSRANNLGPPAQSAAPGKAATAAAAAAAAPAAPAAAPAATANSGTAQPAGPPGSAPAKAAPAKAAPMPPRQVSVDALLQEQVRQQLLTEPGKRASMRRLLSQGKVSKLLKHVSKTRQTPITKLPEELCNILRNVPAVFQVSEESSAVQDVRVSLTDAGEKEPVVEQKNFDTLLGFLDRCLRRPGLACACESASRCTAAATTGTTCARGGANYFAASKGTLPAQEGLRSQSIWGTTLGCKWIPIQRQKRAHSCRIWSTPPGSRRLPTDTVGQRETPTCRAWRAWRTSWRSAATKSSSSGLQG